MDVIGSEFDARPNGASDESALSRWSNRQAENRRQLDTIPDA
jgi:hypothetical protein